ncbi:MAG: methionyl aminopeptidase [Micromonosporaceae bacterium]
MVELKTEAEVDAMGAAGRVVAATLSAVRAAAVPGTSLLELDEVARATLAAHGARSPFLNYHPDFAPSPYPAVICTSVNDVVVHGIPDGCRLREGDLLSVDGGAWLDGWTADAAISFCVGDGTADPADRRLIEVAQQALGAAIGSARPGGRLGDISSAIAAVGRAAGYGIPPGVGGHGIGRRMHEDPDVPNEGRPRRGLPLRPGLVIAIEPMFMAGGRDQVRMAGDGWAMRTGDGSRAAHVEHTVAITAAGPRVLTL